MLRHGSSSVDPRARLPAAARDASGGPRPCPHPRLGSPIRLYDYATGQIVIQPTSASAAVTLIAEADTEADTQPAPEGEGQVHQSQSQTPEARESTVAVISPPASPAILETPETPHVHRTPISLSGGADHAVSPAPDVEGPDDGGSEATHAEDEEESYSEGEESEGESQSGAESMTAEDEGKDEDEDEDEQGRPLTSYAARGGPPRAHTGDREDAENAAARREKRYADAVDAPTGALSAEEIAEREAAEKADARREAARREAALRRAIRRDRPPRGYSMEVENRHAVGRYHMDRRAKRMEMNRRQEAEQEAEMQRLMEEEAAEKEADEREAAEAAEREAAEREAAEREAAQREAAEEAAALTEAVYAEEREFDEREAAEAAQREAAERAEINAAEREAERRQADKRLLETFAAQMEALQNENVVPQPSRLAEQQAEQRQTPPEQTAQRPPEPHSPQQGPTSTGLAPGEPALASPEAAVRAPGESISAEPTSGEPISAEPIPAWSTPAGLGPAWPTPAESISAEPTPGESISAGPTSAERVVIDLTEDSLPRPGPGSTPDPSVNQGQKRPREEDPEDAPSGEPSPNRPRLSNEGHLDLITHDPQGPLPSEPSRDGTQQVETGDALPDQLDQGGPPMDITGGTELDRPPIDIAGDIDLNRQPVDIAGGINVPERDAEQPAAPTRASHGAQHTTNSVQYKHHFYETLLEMRAGSYMREHRQGVSDTSKRLCDVLILQREQRIRSGSLFSQFSALCEIMHNKNEATVFRNLTPLLVPFAKYVLVGSPEAGNILREAVKEVWTHCIPVTSPPPRPTYAIGFERGAFSPQQLDRLQPLIGNFHYASHLQGSFHLLFPFLTCEVKGAGSPLSIAERQNAHSMTVALRGVVALFCCVGRAHELHREILGFSIAHNHDTVAIRAHYVVLDDAGGPPTFWRREVRNFNFAEGNGRRKWASYRIVRNIYDAFVPVHFRRLCSAIDALPQVVYGPLPAPAQPVDQRAADGGPG